MVRVFAGRWWRSSEAKATTVWWYSLRGSKKYGTWADRLLVAMLLLVGAVGCGRPRDPAMGHSFADQFNRKAIGASYFDTIGRYRVIRGRLNIEKAYNHPLWLRRRLPRNVEVSVDVASMTDDGDMKVEIFGDGQSSATTNRGAYMATGYVLCMGAWHNTKSFIARKNEHGKEGIDVVSRVDEKVVKGKTYHWRIVRRGHLLEWYVDGELFLSFNDPEPLYGYRNDHFGFNDWQSDVYFDNLKIRRLN